MSKSVGVDQEAVLVGLDVSRSRHKQEVVLVGSEVGWEASESRRKQYVVLVGSEDESGQVPLKAWWKRGGKGKGDRKRDR